MIIGAFVLMAGTGVVMFFGRNQGLTTVVHQWFSWVFLAGACGHVTANLRPLRNYLGTISGRASVALFMCVLAASFFSWGKVTGPQLKSPIERALVDAPLWALAGTTRIEPEALLVRFRAHGIDATREQSVREIALKSGIGMNRLLAFVYLPE